MNHQTTKPPSHVPLLFLSVLSVSLWWASPTAGQSRQVPAPPQNHPVVIHNATIHTVTDGTIENGYIVFDKGVIADLGEGAAPFPPESVRVNGRDLHVYPGLIAAETNLGLIETGAVDVTHDYRELGRITPEVRAAVAINPDTDLIPVARSNGILLALTAPRGGLISGRAAAIRLDGWTWEDIAIDRDAGLVLNWPRTEPIDAWWMDRSEEEQRKEIAEDLENVETVFDDAVAYINAKDHDETVKTDLRYEAMRSVLDGSRPLFVRAASTGQIESAVAWANRRGIRIIILGGSGADRCADLLAEHDIPVILDGTHNLPSRRHDAYDRPFTVPKVLHEKGVRFCIAPGGRSGHERNLNHNAATAAAYGLPKDEALKAVTIYPAEVLGLADRYGSLEVGKSATLILTTGDPLEITSEVQAAFIDGRQLDLSDRQKELYEKYREKYRQRGIIEDEQ